MKDKDLLILGVVAVGGYLVYKKISATAADIGGAIGAPGQFVKDVEKWFTNETKYIDVNKGIMETTAGAVGTAYSVVGGVQPLGQQGLSQNQGLSNAFNTYVTGGVMTTAATPTAIVLNPSMTVTQRQAVQSSLTTASINAGMGVASKVNWGQTQTIGGSTFPVAGGVITNYAGLSPTAPTANLASLFATGRIG